MAVKLILSVKYSVQTYSWYSRLQNEDDILQRGSIVLKALLHAPCIFTTQHTISILPSTRISPNLGD